MKLRKLKDRIGDLWVKYYPITIQQGVFDEETDETLDVTLTNIKNDITNKANHGYVLGEGEEPKTLKEVDDSLVQLADEVNLKEVKANKQNSLASDGTGVKFPTVDAVNAMVKQTVGTSTTQVMSQKSVTDELELKANQTDLEQLAGDVSVKMRNLITNGGFTNGTAGWTPSNVSDFTVVDSVAQFTATSKGGSITHNSFLNYAGGKKYFFGAYVKTNSPRVDISTAGIAVTNHSGSGDWELLYAIASYPYGGIYSPRIRDNSDNEWSPVYVRSVLAVSLSDVFGLGNEPTKTEFLLLLSIMGIEYFEGEITIPAQKVMQWQLEMIRQNRNAIVALGGTII